MNEREKYEKIWQHEEYRAISPAEQILPGLLKALDYNPMISETLIDFGCGTTRATKKLQDYGYSVLGVDIAYNALSDESSGVPLLVCAIEDIPRSVQAAYGICIDVLEHIPLARLSETLRVMSRSVALRTLVQVANFEENHGTALIGEPLHFIFEDRKWWKAKLAEVFTLVEDADFGDESGLPRYDFVCFR